MAKKKSITRALISIVFIILGVGSVAQLLVELASFDIGGAVGCAFGVLMFILGILGLFRASIKACRAIAVIVCLLSVLNIALAIVAQSYGAVVSPLISGVLAWVFFDIT